MSDGDPDPVVFNKLRRLILRERLPPGAWLAYFSEDRSTMRMLSDPLDELGKTPEDLNITLVEDFAFTDLMAMPAVNHPIWRDAVAAGVFAEPYNFGAACRLGIVIDGSLMRILEGAINAVPKVDETYLEYFAGLADEYPFLGGARVCDADGETIHFPAVGLCVIKNDQNGLPISDDYLVGLTMAYMSYINHGAMAHEVFVLSRRYHAYNHQLPWDVPTSDHCRLSYIQFPAGYFKQFIKQLRRPLQERTPMAEPLVCYRSRWIQWFQDVDAYVGYKRYEPEPDEALKEERLTLLKLLGGMVEHILSGNADMPGLVEYLEAKKESAFIPVARGETGR